MVHCREVTLNVEGPPSPAHGHGNALSRVQGSVSEQEQALVVLEQHALAAMHVLPVSASESRSSSAAVELPSHTSPNSS